MLGRMPRLPRDTWVSLLCTQLKFLSIFPCSFLLQQLAGGLLESRPLPSPCFELPKKPEIVLKTSALRLPSTLAAADPDLASAPGCCLPACHSGREVTDPRQGWECQHLGITSSGEEGTMTNARQVSETAAVAAGRGAETQRKHMKV